MSKRDRRVPKPRRPKPRREGKPSQARQWALLALGLVIPGLRPG